MEVLRQYNTAATILFPLIDRDIQDFDDGPPTFVAGDSQIMKDEGPFANTTNLPVHEGLGIFSLALTATEMTAARIVVCIADGAPEDFEAQAIIIQTFGDFAAGIRAKFQDDDIGDSVGAI